VTEAVPEWQVNADFLAAWDQFLDDHSGRQGDRRSPWALLDEWGALVTQAEEGYTFGADEFENDLAVRALLDRAMRAPSLKKYPQAATIKERCRTIDARYRALQEVSRRPGLPWWRAALPRDIRER
jgi:hypothetical protein